MMKLTLQAIKILYKSILIITLTATINGCASSHFSEEEKAAIKTVSINKKNVIVPEKLFYYGPAQAWGHAISPLLEEIANSAAKEPEDILTDIVNNKGISLSSMLTTTMIQKLKESKTFKVIDHDADAEIKIKVEKYGLIDAGNMGATVKPWIIAEISIIDSHKNIIYQGRYWPNDKPGEDSGKYTGEQYFSNPALLRTGLENSVAQLTDEFVHYVKYGIDPP